MATMTRTLSSLQGPRSLNLVLHVGDCATFLNGAPFPIPSRCTIAQSPWKKTGPHWRRQPDAPAIVLNFQDDRPEKRLKTATFGPTCTTTTALPSPPTLTTATALPIPSPPHTGREKFGRRQVSQGAKLRTLCNIGFSPVRHLVGSIPPWPATSNRTLTWKHDIFQSK